MIIILETAYCDQPLMVSTGRVFIALHLVYSESYLCSFYMMPSIKLDPIKHLSFIIIIIIIFYR